MNYLPITPTLIVVFILINLAFLAAGCLITGVLWTKRYYKTVRRFREQLDGSQNFIKEVNSTNIQSKVILNRILRLTRETQTPEELIESLKQGQEAEVFIKSMLMLAYGDRWASHSRSDLYEYAKNYLGISLLKEEADRLTKLIKSNDYDKRYVDYIESVIDSLNEVHNYINGKAVKSQQPIIKPQ